MALEIQIRHGGLMRCCIQSIEQDAAKRTAAPAEGETLRCVYCRARHEEPNMIFKSGAWEWRRN